MKNKTLGLWMGWTLGVALFTYMTGLKEIAGLIILANWVFVFIGSYRLYNLEK